MFCTAITSLAFGQIVMAQAAEPAKTHWQYIIEGSQVVTSFATLAAVIVAIWLAKRGESQRLQFFPGIYHYTLEQEPFEELRLHLTIVNSGVLPAVIKGTAFTVKIPGFQWSWHFGPNAEAGAFPLKLEHGQQVGAETLFELDKAPWDQIPLKWVSSKHMWFTIETSLGRVYVHRPNKNMLLAMRANIENARNGRAP